MTAESYVEQMRVTQKQDVHVLSKHLGSYRTKDVDQYIEKLQKKFSSMEGIYQERYEEMRTSLLMITRERDTQAARANALEEKLKDFPKYCDRFLEEKGLTAIPNEINTMIQDVDLDDLSNIRNMKAKLRLLESENLKHIKELEHAHNALYEAESATNIIEQLKAQVQAQKEKTDQLQLLLDTQKQQTKQAADELEELKKVSQTRMIELVNEQRELGESQRRGLVQRFQMIIDNQKQYTQQMQQNMAAFVKYMDSLSSSDLAGF